MDSHRFDILTRRLSSRRVAVGGFVAGIAALTAWLDPDSAEARKRRKKKRRKKKNKVLSSPPHQSSPPPPPPPPPSPLPPPTFCAGKNGCLEEGLTCNSLDPLCVCLVTVTGEPFCAQQLFEGPCPPCPVGQACISLTGGVCPGGTMCAIPCEHPL